MLHYFATYQLAANPAGEPRFEAKPGAINVVSGQTHGAVPAQITGTVEQGSVISDDDPAGDIAPGGTTFSMVVQSHGQLDDLLTSPEASSRRGGA